MSIKKIIEGKKEWRAHVSRVKALPQDYQIVYKEIQKYLFAYLRIYYNKEAVITLEEVKQDDMPKEAQKVGPVELNEGIGLLSGILSFFEEGVAAGKDVLEVTGIDVAAFCDTLIEDSKTYADL